MACFLEFCRSSPCSPCLKRLQTPQEAAEDGAAIMTRLGLQVRLSKMFRYGGAVAESIRQYSIYIDMDI